MDTRTEQLTQECKRQSESCLYTSTSLYIWLRILRYLRVAFVVTPLILGSLSGGKILLSINSTGLTTFSAVCAFLAGLLPAVYSALKYDDRLRECSMLAAEFKNLQDRFRQAALIASQKPINEFEKVFNELMNRLEIARKPSHTTPEWCFRMAQNKVKSGDYTYDVDISK